MVNGLIIKRHRSPGEQGQDMRKQISPSGMFGGWVHRYRDELWLLFRVTFAVVVLVHALEKGLWIAPAANPAGVGGYVVDIVGAVELVSALTIGFGFVPRVGACAIIVTVLLGYVAGYSQASFLSALTHLEAGSQVASASPVDELGEHSILWLIIAGAIAVIGGGRYALERKIFKDEVI